MTNKNTEKIKGTIFIIIATLLWGTSFVVTKGATENMPAFMLVSVRSIIGGLFISFIYRKSHHNITKELVLAACFLGVLNAAGMMLQTFGIKYTSAGRSAFLTAAYCVFMPFLEWKVLGNKPKIKNIIAGIICMIGIGLVALTDAFTISSGDLYTLAGSVCFGFMIVFTGKFVKKYESGLLNMIELLSAGVYLGIISLFTETIPASLDMTTVLEVLYLSIFCSGIPFLLQGIAQKTISPTLVTLILGFEAVFGAVFSAIFAGEQFTLRCLIGFALIFLSVFVGELDLKKNRNQKTDGSDN